MIKIYCDKCGKELTGYNNYEVAVNAPVIADYPYNNNENLHLCKNCLKAFNKFLTNKAGTYEVR